ncbi:MAG: DNA primase [Spirochaetaceae bacterium]|nr:DNA primase [Spirochaetaceae bacterium]
METEHLDFLEAVRHAADKASVPLEMGEGDYREDRLKKDALLELYRRVSGSFAWLLKNSDEAKIARDYLLSRGIKEETWDFFQLGYALSDSSWLLDFLLKKNYSKEFLSESGLFSKNRQGYPLFRQRLIFPIFDNSGRPVGFSGRILRGEGPKYINSPETQIYHKGSLLFGLGKTLPHIKELKKFILCEGNLDVLSLYQSGLKNSVAPLGTAFTAGQLKILKRYCQSGIIVFDSDKAGIEASKKAAMLCLKENVKLQSCILPNGKDPADIMLENGSETLKNILSNPINIFDYLLKYTVDKLGSSSVEEKIGVIDELAPYLRGLHSEIEKTSFIEKIADILLLDKKTVISELRGKRETLNAPKKTNKPVNPAITLDRGLRLVLLLLFNPKLFIIFKEEVIPQELGNTLACEVFESMLKISGDIDAEGMLILSEHPGWRDFLVSKESDPVLVMNAEAQVKEIMQTITLERFKKQRDEIALLLKREDTLNNQRAVSELMLEKKRLDQEIEDHKV